MSNHAKDVQDKLEKFPLHPVDVADPNNPTGRIKYSIHVLSPDLQQEKYLDLTFGFMEEVLDTYHGGVVIEKPSNNTIYVPSGMYIKWMHKAYSPHGYGQGKNYGHAGYVG